MSFHVEMQLRKVDVCVPTVSVTAIKLHAYAVNSEVCHLMVVMVSMGTHTLIELHGNLNGVVSPVWRPTFLSTAKEK